MSVHSGLRNVATRVALRPATSKLVVHHALPSSSRPGPSSLSLPSLASSRPPSRRYFQSCSVRGSPDISAAFAFDASVGASASASASAGASVSAASTAGSSSSSSSLAAASSTFSSWSQSITDTLYPYFEPLRDHVHALPDYLGIAGTPHAYAISIVLSTILLRTAITLPLHIRSHNRRRRLQKIVLPAFEKIKGQHGLPKMIMGQYKREGKTSREQFKRYHLEVQQELRSIWYTLLRNNSCSRPQLNRYLPVLITLPLWITLSVAIRLSAVAPTPLSTEIIPWYSPPADLVKSFESSAAMLRDRGMDLETLSRLTLPSGPSLADPDREILAALFYGGTQYANLELSSRQLRKSTAAAEATLARSDLTSEERSQRSQKLAAATRVSTLFLGLFRAAAFLGIVLATKVPSVLLIYWITSALYSLCQNAAFTYFDTKRDQQHISSTSSTSRSSDPSEKRVEAIMGTEWLRVRRELNSTPRCEEILDFVQRQTIALSPSDMAAAAAAAVGKSKGKERGKGKR